LIAWLGGITGDLLTAPGLLIPFLTVLYLAGAYRLFVFLTGHRQASLLVALLSLLGWRALMDSWGLNLPETPLPRNLFLALVPWLVLPLLRARDSLWVGIPVFLVIGLLANLHPVSAFGFTQVLLLIVLFEGRFRPAAFLKCAALGMAAAVPTLPFAITYSKGLQVAREPIPYEIVADLLRNRVAGFYPFSSESVIETILSLLLPSALAVWGIRIRKRQGQGRLNAMDRWFVWFAFATLVVSLAGTAFFQILSRATQTKPPIIDQMRTLRFIYLPLFAFGSYALAHQLRIWQASGLRRRTAILSAAVALLCVGSFFPAESFLAHAWNRWVHQRSGFGRDTAIRGLGEWAKANTPRDALVHFDSPHFRFYSERSLVLCRKDGGILLYSGSDRLLEWHRRFHEAEKFPEKSSAHQLAFARKYKADYLVLDRRQPALHWQPRYTNSHYLLYALD
jgi:hypothetical protein